MNFDNNFLSFSLFKILVLSFFLPNMQRTFGMTELETKVFYLNTSKKFTHTHICIEFLYNEVKTKKKPGKSS